MALGTLTVTKRYISGPLTGITVTDQVSNFDNAYPAYGETPENIIGQTFTAALTHDQYIVDAIDFVQPGDYTEIVPWGTRWGLRGTFVRGQRRNANS